MFSSLGKKSLPTGDPLLSWGPTPREKTMLGYGGDKGGNLSNHGSTWAWVGASQAKPIFGSSCPFSEGTLEVPWDAPWM